MEIIKRSYISFVLLFPIMLILLVAGCSTSISSYQDTKPKFDLAEYFNGELTAWGMVQDYQDNVTRRFCVELNGSWQGNKGLLAEKFYFDDGEISYRDWHLTRVADNRYQGNAKDVIGTASGQTSGFAFQWQYVLDVNIDGSNYEFFLDDWMYQIDQYRVFNKTEMKKFGITLAELTIFFDKQQPNRGCS